MDKVKMIRIFMILTVLVSIGCCAVFFLRDEKDVPEETATEQVFMEEAETETEKDAVAVSRPLDYKFVIVEEGDYLTVYLADRTTVYEYTGIRYSDLEETLRQKIRDGYCIKDEETLFGFLENYSS